MLCVMFVLSGRTVMAQDAVTQDAAVRDAPPAVFYPMPREAGDCDAAVGLRVLTVPRDVAEEEINKAPSLELQAVLGLPLQFSVPAFATLQYFTNHFRTGLRWTHRFRNLSISAGDDVAFWFGFVDFEGFDNRANGWMNYPNVSVGYDFGDVRLTAKVEAVYLMSMQSFAGEDEVSMSRNFNTGWALMLVLEQPFWKDTHVLLGFRLARTDFHYQTWFAFSTFDRKLLFSELLFGVLL
jgi:hypothetical protein